MALSLGLSGCPGPEPAAKELARQLEDSIGAAAHGPLSNADQQQLDRDLRRMEAQPASSGAAGAQHALSNAGARAANALDADIELALERHPELTKLTVRGTICWDVFGIDILGATAPVPANQPPMPALLGIAWQLKGPPGTAAAYVDEFAGALCRA